MEDVARLEKKGWDGGRGGRGQGALPGGVLEGMGACRCAGNIGNVSEKLQMFRSKERARRTRADRICGQRKRRGIGQRRRWAGQRMHFVAKSEFLWAKKNPSSHMPFGMGSVHIPKNLGLVKFCLSCAFWNGIGAEVLS